MNIALMAHDRKKELMVQFCIAYCGILAEHSLCATHVTGKLVSEATGLPITLYLHADQGGAQQIGMAGVAVAVAHAVEARQVAERLARPLPPTLLQRKCSCRGCGAATLTGATL